MITCDLCPATALTTTEAIDAGWLPSYFVGDDDTGCPICPKCAATKCRQTSDGELEVKPVANLPATIGDYGRYLPPIDLFSRRQ